MKKLLFVLTLLVSYSAYSQKYYDEKDYNSFVDYDKKIININYKKYKIKGVFQELRGKNYNNYLVVKGDNNIHFVIESYTNSTFYGIDVLEGEYKKVLKGFSKGRRYSKKVKLLFSNLPSDKKMDDFKLISEFIRDHRIKKEKEKEKEKENKENVASEIIESGLIGTYKIEILKHDNLDYSKVQTKGKIIITSIGITIQTEIPTLGLVRGSYLFEQTNPLQRMFVCNISKGFGNSFSLSLSSSGLAGAFTVMSGSRSETTTFMIKD
tara:strand:+ start:2660 stop:3457 length:798 start_codon:yes stop_codon:yes gene_type:complete